MNGMLLQAFLYLSVAVVAVPIANRFGLGSVLGYLIAGILIGPIFGLVGAETQALQHFAEFGVVMMLFLIGLEVDPKLLWQMRSRLIGLGGLQIALTTAVIAGGALYMGLAWQTAIVIGLIASLSSTAIVLQTLNEKGLLKSEGGQGSFSVLLVQDIAVILMLAAIPLLALPGLAGEASDLAHGDSHTTSKSLIEDFPNWARALITLSAIGCVIGAGHFLSRPLFRFIAESRLREIFTAAALFLVISIALLMEFVGLSPALGTFLAGVVLANSEYKHELESDIAPFKGLLLGLFFITVGAGIDLDLLVNDVRSIASMVLLIMLAKFIILLGIAQLFNVPRAGSWLMAFGLCQMGEFGFVLLSFSAQNNALPPDLVKTLSLVVALSMLLTPFLFILYDRLISGHEVDESEKDADEISEKGAVIIAGHGRFGQVINRVLISSGHHTVVLDHKSALVEGMRQFGIRSFYGDATRPDLLHSAGLREAKAIVIAMDDKVRTTDLVKYCKRERPDLHIVARAFDRAHVYELYNAGANDIVRETFDSAVRASRYTLEAMGEPMTKIDKITNIYVQHDRDTLVKLARVWDPDINVFDNTAYKDLVKEHNGLLKDAIKVMSDEL